MTETSPPLTAAERKQLERDRRREGIRLAEVEIDSTVLRVLIRDGWIEDGCDREELGAAVTNLLDCWARGNLSSENVEETMSRVTVTNTPLR